MAEHIYRDEQVWRTCNYLRKEREEPGKCLRCPHETEWDGETVQQMCRGLAEEMINVVETGDPWRKPVNPEAGEDGDGA